MRNEYIYLIPNIIKPLNVFNIAATSVLESPAFHFLEAFMLAPSNIFFKMRRNFGGLRFLTTSVAIIISCSVANAESARINKIKASSITGSNSVYA